MWDEEGGKGPSSCAQLAYSSGYDDPSIMQVEEEAGRVSFRVAADNYPPNEEVNTRWLTGWPVHLLQQSLHHLSFHPHRLLH
ncbi:hypothetical protein Pmani_034800 [Petrolisthes manimaculis]|uniref:Uncharacterized protein n=1 Tax=Petrolisthes manimaculis TaxID=1843537 RepID=A0AAE1TR64_9EUCA|nr:hypothetical protein Pmani_034800 [Petrolisthes manimaculis]